MTKIASLMNDHLFFSLPISQDYGREQWRADLRHLIKTAGSEERDVVILDQSLGTLVWQGRGS